MLWQVGDLEADIADVNTVSLLSICQGGLTASRQSINPPPHLSTRRSSHIHPLAKRRMPSEYSDCSSLSLVCCQTQLTEHQSLLADLLSRVHGRGGRNSSPHNSQNNHKSFINISGVGFNLPLGFSFTLTEPLKGLQLLSWQCPNRVL